MIKKKYHFLCGLPRSGSTVLSAILNQHPDIFCTPTSPLLDQIVDNQNIWHSNQAVLANPIPAQLDNITREMIEHFWDFSDKPVTIDKNRGWGKNVHMSKVLFGYDVKMIACVRDIPSIMASWLTLLRKNPNNYMDKLLTQRNLIVNDENRMDVMWNEMVLDCVESLQAAKRDAKELMLIDYDKLVEDPNYVLGELINFLELKHHNFDIENIINQYTDDDMAAWNLEGIHTIRNKLVKTSTSAKEILGDSLFDKYNNKNMFLGE